MNMKYCTKCGNEVSNTDKFCADCGQPTDQTSNDEVIKADLKVELTNTTTDKAFQAVGSSISSGKKAVKKGTKATTSFISKLFWPTLILGAIIGMILYSLHLEEERVQEAERKEQNLNSSYKNIKCITKKSRFKENLKTEKEICVYTQYRANYNLYENPWIVTRSSCGLSYSELQHYKDWYNEGMSCVDIYNE